MDPLLRTKTQIPAVRATLVARPQLAGRLDQGLTRSLTLVSAPAGFGKTTLIATWAHHSAVPVAWLSIDEGDNDPARFVAYLATALQGLDLGLADELLPASETASFAQLQRIVTTLINQIDRLAQDLVLVLDDYHLITTAPAQALVTYLIDHSPGTLHLVIAARADPALPLARLRTRDQLVELRASDLRFSSAEAAAFLNDVMGLGLRAEDIDRLAARTEGWIGGLQMAALSMRGREDLSGFVDAFSGSHRYVMDYLLEEVLERQPEAVQRFLLQTSILDQLTGPLCDAVCETRDARSLLASLERANLFILPMDDRREWYRYHRLFADLLRQRLERLQGEAIPDLHRRASRWYAGHGFTAEAIDHALAGRDFATAADLVAGAAEATLARSELVTFLGWVDALPAVDVAARPALGIYRTWALFWSGHAVDEIEATLAQLGTLTERQVGQVAAIRALVSLYRGVTAEAALQSPQALSLLAPDDGLFRGLLAILNVLVPLNEGDPYAGGEFLVDVAEQSAASGNVLAAVFALSALGDLRVRQLRLHEAEAEYQRALTLATDDRGVLLPVAGQALMGLGTVALMQNRVQTALDTLTRGIALSGEAGAIVALDGLVQLVRIYTILGDRAKAHATIAEALSVAEQFDVTEIDDWIVRAEQARLWILEGNLTAARSWARDAGLLDPAGPQAEAGPEGRLRKYGLIIAAGLDVAEGRYTEALAALAEAQPLLEARGRIAALVELLVVKALAYVGLHASARAREALHRALTLAAPGDYLRPFVDAGPALLPVLHDLAPEATPNEAAPRALDVAAPAASAAPVAFASPAVFAGPAEYAGRIRAAIRKPPGTAGAAMAPRTATAALEPLLDPLTERELDVLRLLPGELNSTEIADTLYLATSTVRSHIKAIYSKLDAHSRAEAVDRARALDLL